jgi:hypothetical protein
VLESSGGGWRDGRLRSDGAHVDWRRWLAVTR